jgi:anti-anti-sigma factor
MSLRKDVYGDTCEIFVKGRVDGAAANELEIDLINQLKQPSKNVLVNFAEANFLCSAAIRVLLQYHRQFKGQQKSLLVSRVSPEVDSILTMTGFRDMLVEKIQPS